MKRSCRKIQLLGNSEQLPLTVRITAQTTTISRFLTINDRDILNHAGKISHEMAKELAETQYDTFHRNRLESGKNALSDFDKAVKQIESKKQQDDQGG